jgi:hypothetical protein
LAQVNTKHKNRRNNMAVSGTFGGTSRDGKPINIGDAISISGFVTAITGVGSQASLTVQCAGVAANPLTPNVPYNVTVIAADTTATQSL